MHAEAKQSPWAEALGPNLAPRLLGLLSRDGTDKAMDTWCWQALHLLQEHLTTAQQQHILHHPVAYQVSWYLSVVLLLRLILSWRLRALLGLAHQFGSMTC